MLANLPVCWIEASGRQFIRFSLGNLKVLDVSYVRKKPKQGGAKCEFKTMLDLPSLTVLRVWAVAQRLTWIPDYSHTPPKIQKTEFGKKTPFEKGVAGPTRNKYIQVLFSVIPLGAQEHQLFIQNVLRLTMAQGISAGDLATRIKSYPAGRFYPTCVSLPNEILRRIKSWQTPTRLVKPCSSITVTSTCIGSQGHSALEGGEARVANFT